MHPSENCKESEGESLWILVVGKAQVKGIGHKWGEGRVKLGGHHVQVIYIQDN